MKEETIKIIYFTGLALIFILLIVAIIEQNDKYKEQLDTKPNYQVMYNMCKSKCSNYTTFDIASKEEVGMKIVLYQNKTIKEIECLCENNNMSRSIKLW